MIENARESNEIISTIGGVTLGQNKEKYFFLTDKNEEKEGWQQRYEVMGWSVSPYWEDCI